jgi:hypothetical protein
MRVLLLNQPDDLANLLRQRGLEVRTADGTRALEVALAIDLFAEDAEEVVRLLRLFARDA